jgi:transposase
MMSSVPGVWAWRPFLGLVLRDNTVVAKWFRSADPDQGCLLPVDVRSWLPPDHLAFQVAGVVGQLDLAGFDAAYRADGQGQAPYDPAMMTALLFYCYFKGIRSSRKIAGACIDDLGCRVICGGASPSHQAVCQFIRRHRPEIRRLFVQVLCLLAAEGAVQGHTGAVDGSPVSGNASRFANLTGEQLADRIAATEAAIDADAEAWLAGAAADTQLPLPDSGDDDDDDDDDDSPSGDGQDPPPGGGVPRRLAGLTAKLARLRAAQARLAERQAVPGGPAARVAAARVAVDRVAARLAAAEAAQAAKMDKYQAAVAAGKAWRYGKKPVPAAQAARVAAVRKNLATAQTRLAVALAAAAASPVKVSATDPDSRLVPAKNGGGWTQGWNLQLTAARRQILLAAELHDNPADAGALTTMITAAAANCELAGLAARIRGWLADSGYASAAAFKELDHLMLLVAVRNEAAQAGRGDGRQAVPPGWEKMAARLATPAGKKLYARRAAQVEPAFAQFFARFGRYVNYRGRDAADTEIKLLATVHNLAKLLDHRRRHPVPAA